MNFKLALLFILLFGCVKYDEGGNSYRIYKKLTGVYSLEQYLIAGMDSTEYYRNLCNNIVRISSAGELEYKKVNVSELEEYGYVGKFSIADKMSLSNISFSNRQVNESIFKRLSYWEIKKLKNGQCWLYNPEKLILIKLRQD